MRRALLGRTRRRAGALAWVALLVVPGAALAAPPRVELATSQQMPVASQALCIRTAGTAQVGREITSTGLPERWQLPGSPYIGAIFDSCARRVKLYFGSPPNNAFRWNVGYGQRENSTRVIFSHQRQYNDNASNVGRVASDWFTDDHPSPRVYAFFRVQSCTENLAGLALSCSRWSPSLTIFLGSNQLTARDNS